MIPPLINRGWKFEDHGFGPERPVRAALGPVSTQPAVTPRS